MIKKSSDKQKKHVIQKNIKPKPKKRNNEDVNDNTSEVNNNNKKNKENTIEISVDEANSKKLDNDENNENGSSDNDKGENDADVSNNTEDDMKTDDEEITDDDDEDKSENETTKSTQIVPMLQSRAQSIHSVKETVLHTVGYCETVVGFNSAGKKDMLKHITDSEKIVLRGYVRKEIFRMIKFLSAEKLSIDGTIMTLLYNQITVSTDAEKIKKHSGVRYVLQRQLNSKRNYCIEKIVKQMKGIYFLV
jgi:hypothetical protein